MGNFMSCVLICGAMEVVQVVNTNGRVEKLIRPVRAAEIIWAHERYNAAAAAGPPPDEKQQSQQPKPRPTSGKKEEQFVLVPLSDDVVGGRKPGTVGDNAGSRTRGKSSLSDAAATVVAAPQQGHSQPFKVKKEGGVTTLIVSKRYLEQLLAEKSPASVATKPNEVATQDSSSSRRSSSSSSAKRPSIWRPALESISESISGSSSGGGSGGRSGSGHSQSQSKQQHHQHRRHRQQQQQQQGLVKF